MARAGLSAPRPQRAVGANTDLHLGHQTPGSALQTDLVSCKGVEEQIIFFNCSVENFQAKSRVGLETKW